MQCTTGAMNWRSCPEQGWPGLGQATGRSRISTASRPVPRQKWRIQCKAFSSCGVALVACEPLQTAHGIVPPHEVHCRKWTERWQLAVQTFGDRGMRVKSWARAASSIALVLIEGEKASNKPAFAIDSLRSTRRHGPPNAIPTPLHVCVSDESAGQASPITELEARRGRSLAWKCRLHTV